jgi:histidinol-phosphatase
MASDLAAELDFALSVADAADAYTLPHFQARSFNVSLKENQTEVTEIDRGCETLVMDLIRSARPHHAWYGEEHGAGGLSSSEFTWVVDPIDGTSNFVRGVPVWATLIALVHADLGPVMGVASAPALGMRWWGFVDGGAYFNGSPIQVSSVASLSEASLSITANSLWDKIGKTTHIDELTRAASRVRGYGDFWQHMLVAQGAVDVAVDAVGLEPYDIAALIPIVCGAGGMLTNRKGIVDWRANTAISSNGLFHSDVIEILTRKN